ncbi:MAG: response regulator [Desulfobacterales bacterium]|nr:response regulator [Desulfobacterales bacterium]
MYRPVINIYTKILLITLPLVLLTFFGSIYISYVISYKSITKLAENCLQSRLDDAISIVDKYQSHFHKLNFIGLSEKVNHAQKMAIADLKTVRIPNGGFIWVIDNTGKVILHPQQDIQGKNVKDSPWFNLLFAKASGNLQYEMNTKQYIARFHFMASWNWYILASNSIDEIYHNIHQMLYWLLLISFFVIILMISGFLFLARWITKPLEMLTIGAEQVAEGNLNVNIPVISNDEIGRLTLIFNYMITQLKGLITELKTSHKELEDRVEQRTTELTSTNIALQQAKAEADRITQAKSEFIANMSHEIRTPMNGVIASVDLALKENCSPKLRRYLEMIESSGYTLLGIISDILDLSKIESGKLDIECIPFRMDVLMEDIMNVFIHKTIEKGIDLLVDIDPKIPFSLIGDSFRLQQIINNLVGNAVKFTPNGGKITIGVNELLEIPDGLPISKTIEEGYSALQFFVKDTGVGIRPEDQPKLFEAFSQADASISRKFGGTGLGLHISKQLVELMHGCIWIESAPNQGTTFYVVVTLKKQDQQELFNIPHDIRELRVLVLDDSPDHLMISEKILKSFEYEVETFSSAQEVLDRLDINQLMQHPFDLLILDWKMPEMDGIELTKSIREIGIKLPILMLTAFGSELDIAEAEQMGIDAIIYKPINPSTLFDAIMDVFGKTTDRTTKIEKKSVHISIYKDQLEGKRILVAEDNVTNQEIAQAVLQSVGISVEVVNNGQEAVEAVHSEPFDAVLMDMQMPVMDGYEAARTIRKYSEFADLPIIAMTAHALIGDKQKCIQAGMNGYVTKPIKQQVLFETLLKFIQPKMISTHDNHQGNNVFFSNINYSKLPNSLPGIEIKKALDALDIDPDIFKDILMGFVKNNLLTAKTLQDAFIRKDWAQLQHMGHSLKGSSSNIGALKLETYSKELEFACKDSSVHQAHIEYVVAELTTVIESINSISSPENSESGAHSVQHQVDNVKLQNMLYQLIEAIDNSDPGVIRPLMAELSTCIEKGFFEKLKHHINNYDYTEAKETLKIILNLDSHD